MIDIDGEGKIKIKQRVKKLKKSRTKLKFETSCSEGKVSGAAETSRGHDTPKQTWRRFIGGGMVF